MASGDAGLQPATRARGHRPSLRLSDGTLVSLAPGTTLRTPSNYGTRDRIVEPEGEAVFTVTHDVSRPFAMRAPRVVATDLGTRFAVRAFAGDSTTDVVVAEGVVAVRPAHAVVPAQVADSVILKGRPARSTR
jgi:ferric-dicitrate binding protein FerR (iron transport regulator)